MALQRDWPLPTKSSPHYGSAHIGRHMYMCNCMLCHSTDTEHPVSGVTQIFTITFVRSMRKVCGLVLQRLLLHF